MVQLAKALPFGKAPVGAISLSALVRRGDTGRVEDHGRIALFHRDPKVRLAWALERKFHNDRRSLEQLVDEAAGHSARVVARALRDLGRDEDGVTTVTNTGLALVTNRLKGVGDAEPVFIGWGTGSGQSVTSTALATEKAVDLSTGTGTRTTGTSSQQTTTTTSDTYRVTGTRTATGSGAVTEAGLFNDADITEGTMFVYGDFSAINLVSGDSIAFTFNVVFDQA